MGRAPPPRPLHALLRVLDGRGDRGGLRQRRRVVRRRGLRRIGHRRRLGARGAHLHEHADGRVEAQHGVDDLEEGRGRERGGRGGTGAGRKGVRGGEGRGGEGVGCEWWEEGLWRRWATSKNGWSRRHRRPRPSIPGGARPPAPRGELLTWWLSGSTARTCASMPSYFGAAWPWPPLSDRFWDAAAARRRLEAPARNILLASKKRASGGRPEWARSICARRKRKRLCYSKIITFEPLSVSLHPSGGLGLNRRSRALATSNPNAILKRSTRQGEAEES